MEQVRSIATFYCVVAIVCCIVTLCYIYRLRKKNPWWKTDDTKCSPPERAYRQRERQKEMNVFFLCMATVVACMGMMIIHLYASDGGGAAVSLRLVPFALLIVLCISGIKKS